MKTIKEYTYDELINLTIPEIEGIIDYECALQGVPLLREPVAPTQPDISKSVCIYSIAGIKTTDYSVAQKIRDVVSLYQEKLCDSDYDYRISYDYRHFKKLTSSKISELITLNSDLVMSLEELDKTKNSLELYKSQKERYEELKKEYDSNIAAVKSIKSEVWGIVQSACDEENRFQDAKSQFERYLDLATGDVEIAKKFFLKAFSSKIKPKILDRLFPEEVVKFAIP